MFTSRQVPTSGKVKVQIWTSWSILVLVKLAIIQWSNEVIGLDSKVNLGHVWIISIFWTMRLLPATNLCALSPAGEWIAAAMIILAFCNAVPAHKCWCIQVLPILQLQLQYILSFFVYIFETFGHQSI